MIGDILSVVKELRSLRGSQKIGNLESRIRMADYCDKVSDVYSKLRTKVDQSQKKGTLFLEKEVFDSPEYLLAYSLMERFETVIGRAGEILGKSFLTPSVKADSMCDWIHDEESIIKILREREKRPIKLEPLEQEPIPIEVMA